MSRVIEDFSKRIEMVNPENGYKHTDFVDLKVEDWGGDCYVASTFNCDSLNTAKQLVEALKKYRKLRFETGVTGGTKNDLIQRTMIRHMKNLLGDKVECEFSGMRYASAVFTLKEN